MVTTGKTGVSKLMTTVANQVAADERKLRQTEALIAGHVHG